METLEKSIEDLVKLPFTQKIYIRPNCQARLHLTESGMNRLANIEQREQRNLMSDAAIAFGVVLVALIIRRQGPGWQWLDPASWECYGSAMCIWGQLP